MRPGLRFALALFATIMVGGVAKANHPIPVQLDANFHYLFDLKVGSGAFMPRAPWYTYFPADPNIGMVGPMTPFPNWPGQFPPPNGIGVSYQTPRPMMMTPYQPVGYQMPVGNFGYPGSYMGFGYR